MSTAIMYAVALLALGLSWGIDRARTGRALAKAWKALENILPQFLGIIFLVGLVLAVLDPGSIAGLLGKESGWRGVVLAALIGAVTLIPGFVSFPLAALLMREGAGAMQMGAFVSALMMVGVVTTPVESRYFGWRMTILRNGLAFLFSFVVAWAIGVAAG